MSLNNFITLADLAKKLGRTRHSVWHQRKKLRVGTLISGVWFLNPKEEAAITKSVGAKREQYDKTSKALKK